MKIKSLTYLRGLHRRLAATRRFEHGLGGVVAPQKGIGRTEWVLSRALYRFARFDLKGVPRAQRARALELQVRQWAPFPRTARYVIWDEDVALVWAWDANAVESAMAAVGVMPGKADIVPETALHECRAESAVLAKCLDGIEGQVWRGASLESSRWWAQVPAEGEWIAFQRDAGIQPARLLRQVPTVTSTHLQDRPWGTPTAFDKLEMTEGTERRIVSIVAVCLLVPSLWYGAQISKMSMAHRDRTAELEQLKLRAEPVLSARGQALEAMNRITILQAAIDRYPDQASLMAKVAELLPKVGATLREWDFAGGKLKLQIVSTSRTTSSEFVKLFQSAGMFRNVEATPSNDTGMLLLNMEVLPQSEIGPSGDKVGAAR